MPANIETLAYQGETPWHSIGEHVTDPAVIKSVPKFLEAAGLNWNVALRPMYYRNGDKAIKVSSRRAVVRDTDGRLLSTVGGNYHPMQNVDAFAVLQPACDRLGVTIDVAGAVGRGDRVWMLAKLPEDIEPVPGDRIRNYLFILTGHNGWTSYSGRLTQVRAVCENTIALALRDEAFVKLRHTETEAAQLAQVTEVVTHMLETAKRTGESFKTLAGHRLTAAEITEYVEEVLNLDYDNPVAARRRDTIVQLATATGKGRDLAPDTAWAAFNAVTEYIDHVRPGEAKAVKTIKQANESALFGVNEKIKIRALEVARRLVAA